MTGITKVRRYVEAVEELRTLEAQVRDFPELKQRPAFLDTLNRARVAARETLGDLNGSQLSAAQRELRARGISPRPLQAATR